jgi:hypothetical protein
MLLYSYIGGRYRDAYTQLFFRELSYATYDVEQTDMREMEERRMNRRTKTNS